MELRQYTEQCRVTRPHHGKKRLEGLWQVELGLGDALAGGLWFRGDRWEEEVLTGGLLWLERVSGWSMLLAAVVSRDSLLNFGTLACFPNNILCNNHDDPGRKP